MTTSPAPQYDTPMTAATTAEKIRKSPPVGSASDRPRLFMPSKLPERANFKPGTANPSSGPDIRSARPSTATASARIAARVLPPGSRCRPISPRHPGSCRPPARSATAAGTRGTAPSRPRRQSSSTDPGLACTDPSVGHRLRSTPRSRSRCAVEGLRLVVCGRARPGHPRNSSGSSTIRVYGRHDTHVLSNVCL